ncbi:MAG TPA: hypothetical protein VGH80_01440 [Xanthomonadaceae bacterium]|jgi:hypothetical protein
MSDPNLRTALQALLMGTCAAACAYGPIARAEGDGDLAMPGLWKHDVSVVSHGHPGKPKARWHCLLDDDDPFKDFAGHLTVPGAKCTPGDEQRSASGYTWTLTCSGHRTLAGHIDFDSNEHYVGGIVSADHRELVHVEGRHRAACTDPSD